MALPPRISLKAARINRDLTQEEAAKELEISTATYNAWEQAPWKISGLHQKRLAEIYQYPLDYINFLPIDLSKTQY